ncbi:Nucleoid occlusion protein [Moraxellaceae bacterium 17A]|nr:Nucleoid occlusion protein [Moraxellaceae bacterium 17A]
MSKDIKALLAQKLAENSAKHLNANQSAHLELGNELKKLPLNKVRPNRFQPRTVFDEKEIASLAESIKEMGLLQPVTVREIDEGNYELIAGERRFKAHELLGKTHIDAIVTQADDSEIAILALAENASREDLCDFEIGKALRSIEALFPNKSRLAEAVGIDRKEMYRYFAYRDLPASFLEKVERNPKLLSRSAAYDIKQVINELQLSEQQITEILSHVWDMLELGKLEQGKIAEFIRQQSLKLSQDILTPAIAAPLDIKPIISNGKPIGKFHHKGKKYVVEINAKDLDEQQRTEIEQFIETLMTKNTTA